MRTSTDGIRQAFLMASEGLPVRKIVAELSERGLVAPNGRPFTVSTLWRHLRDPGYAGIGKSRRTFRIKELTVSERLFGEAQKELRSKGRAEGALG